MRTRWPLIKLLVRDKAAFFGLIVFASVGFCAAFAPILAPFAPNEQALSARLKPPMHREIDGRVHWLGTDQLGRDVLTRMLYGSRVSLVIGATTVGIAGTAGTAIGLLSGYYGGIVDDVTMRLADAQLSIPFVLIAIAIVSAAGPGISVLILVLVITGWVIYARVARSVALSVREMEYIEAARALGASSGRILLRHVAPTVISPLIVITSFQLSAMIFGEAALSFLGLGVRPPNPSWGSMLGDGRVYLQVAWWLPTFPGVALALTMLSINLVGDWLRDWFDPRLRQGY